MRSPSFGHVPKPHKNCRYLMRVSWPPCSDDHVLLTSIHDLDLHKSWRKTPHSRCYVSVLGRWGGLEGHTAFVSLNAPLIFPVVIILTQSVTPTALPSLFFFRQPSQRSGLGAGHCGNALQSIFTLWLASSGRWFLLLAGYGLVYSIALCRGCSPQEVQVFPAHFVISSFFFTSRDPPSASWGSFYMQH